MLLKKTLKIFSHQNKMKNDEKCDQSTVMLSLEIIKSWNAFHCVQMVPISSSAVKRSIGSTTGCTITEKAPTRAFSWLKAATTAFTFKTLC